MEHAVHNIFLFSFFRDITSCSSLKVNGSFGRTFGLQLLGQRISKARNHHEALGWPSAATRCYIPENRTTTVRTWDPTFLFPKWKYAVLSPNLYKAAYRLTVVPGSPVVQQLAYGLEAEELCSIPGLFFTACRPAVGPNHLRIKWVTGLSPRTEAPLAWSWQLISI
jgi:hypothetical protein